MAFNDRALFHSRLAQAAAWSRFSKNTFRQLLGFALGHYSWPSGEKKRNIPEDTVPRKEGTNIVSSDGEHVGDGDRLFLEPDSNQVTHFLISQGILLKDQKLVPAHWVKSVDEDSVYLVVSSKLLERLPAPQE